MSLPSVEIIRKRIEETAAEDFRLCYMSEYLFAARISEVAGAMSPGDSSTLYGIKGSDAKIVEYRGEEIAVFSVKTAKREGRIRTIGLPFRFEPWAKIVYDYFKKMIDEDVVFPFTRQEAWVNCKEIFQGLSYPIERYVIFLGKETDELGVMNVKIREVAAHSRAFRLHALRHLRATELVEAYGFDGFNLATYGGWTLRTMTRVSPVMERYLSLGWQSYIQKLMVRR